MNIQENINYFAQVNGSKCYPKREEDINKDISYFEIKKNLINGKYIINCYNYEKHDNADRMHQWKMYLYTNVLPNISKDCDISGFYNIELHDSYTYLDNDKDYSNVMCFSKFKNDNGPVLVPDPYMLNSYGGLVVNDTENWVKKFNKTIFCGTTTGNRNPDLNDRINTCLWSINKPHCDFYITRIAQIEPKLLDDVKDFSLIYRNNIPIENQLKYKYHLCLDGNTCRFDVWYYNTTSIILKKKSKEMLWYYPMLQDKFNYVEIDDLDNIENVMNFFNNNNNNAYNILLNSRQTYNNLFRPIVPQSYLIYLFETIASNK